MSKEWLAVYGCPGTGKTTLLKRIACEYPEYQYTGNSDILTEGTLLRRYHKKLFEEGDHSYFFRFQMEALPLRFWQSQNAPNHALIDESIFSTFAYSHALKALGWLSEDDYHTFMENYKTMLRFLDRPSCILFLDCPYITTVLSRIVQRKRGIEKKFTIEYLEALQNSFALLSDAIRQEMSCKLVRIDTEELDEDQLYVRAVERLISVGFIHIP